MKKSKITKLVLWIILFLIIAIPTISMASGTINPDDYNPGNSKVDIGASTIKTKANVIIGTIRNIGIVVSVLMLVILGIKFMLGSIEEKAEYKKTMIPYVIGAFMITAIPQLVQIIYDITTASLN